MALFSGLGARSIQAKHSPYHEDHNDHDYIKYLMVMMRNLLDLTQFCPKDVAERVGQALTPLSNGLDLSPVEYL